MKPKSIYGLEKTTGLRSVFVGARF